MIQTAATKKPFIRIHFKEKKKPNGSFAFDFVHTYSDPPLLVLKHTHTHAHLRSEAPTHTPLAHVMQ